jgi:hypothetical protein
VQTFPQEPQLFALLVMLISQPFEASMSQSINPTLQLAIPHAPLVQTPVPFATEEQAVPFDTGGYVHPDVLHILKVHGLLLLQMIDVLGTQVPAPSQVDCDVKVGLAQTAAVQTVPLAALLKPQVFEIQVRVWHIVSVPGQFVATVHWPLTLTVAVGASAPSVAVIVALAAPEATLVALKVACVAPVEIVTLAGTVTAAELEESVTEVPATDGAAKVTVKVA